MSGTAAHIHITPRMTTRLLGVTILLTVAALLAAPGPAAASPAPCASRCVTRIKLPAPIQPFGITRGPRHSEWFSMNTAIGRVSRDGHVTVYHVAGTHGDDIGWLTAGPRDVIWFAERGAGRIGRITRSGAITQFPIPWAGASPQGIVVDRAGDVGFTDQSNSVIGRLDPSTGNVRRYPIPTPDSAPVGLALGPGGALWFTETSASKIGRMTLGGAFTEYPLASGSAPFRIVAGADHALWFTELGAGKLGRITTGGRLTQYPISGGPVGITTGKDHHLYVVLFTARGVVRVNLRGRIDHRWRLPGARGPLQVATGRGRDIWVTDGYGGNVYRVTPFARRRDQ